MAAALVGSFAKGCGDRISDLDIAVFVQAGTAAAFIDAAHAALATPDVLNHHRGEHAGRGCFRKYVYLDFTSCEIHAVAVPTTFKLFRPYIALWDPAAFLASTVADGPPPRHEDFSAYPNGDAGLVWELVDCIKWMQRGRHRLTKDHLRKLVAAIDRADTPSG